MRQEDARSRRPGDSAQCGYAVIAAETTAQATSG
jgi:hypothetical protein